MNGRLVAAAAGVAGAALLAAGCGGSSGRLSKSQYEQKLQTEGRALQSSVNTASGSPTSLGELANSLGSAQAAATKAANDLDGLKPPKDAEADNAKLVKALHVIADEMGKLKKAAARGDQAAVANVSQELGSSPALKDATAAAADLKKKGYNIGALGQ